MRLTLLLVTMSFASASSTLVSGHLETLPSLGKDSFCRTICGGQNLRSMTQPTVCRLAMMQQQRVFDRRPRRGGYRVPQEAG